MSEENKILYTIEVSYKCDSCGMGYMILKQLPTTTDNIIHKCKHCGVEQVLPMAYPYIKYTTDIL